jgi:hypothetical protein
MAPKITEKEKREFKRNKFGENYRSHKRIIKHHEKNSTSIMNHEEFIYTNIISSSAHPPKHEEEKKMNKNHTKAKTKMNKGTHVGSPPPLLIGYWTPHND